MVVEDTIVFVVTSEPELAACGLIGSVVHSVLSMFAFSECICSMDINYALGAHTFVAISGCTASVTASMTLTLAEVAPILTEKGGPCGCVSKFCGEAGWCFIF
jgi:hypothetical protein